MIFVSIVMEYANNGDLLSKIK